MSDPLVQELRKASGRADIVISVANLLFRAALTLDAACQREEAQLSLLATVKRLLLQQAVDEALKELDGIDAAADLRRADRDPAVPGLTE